MSVLLDKSHAVEPGHLLNCICEKAAMPLLLESIYGYGT